MVPRNNKLRTKLHTAVCLLSFGVSAAKAVTVQDLGTLGGDVSFAFDINDFDHVVGIARNGSDENAVFLFHGGAMDETPLAAVIDTMGVNINSVVAGCARGTDGVIYPAIFNAPANTTTMLGSFGSIGFGFNGTATGINIHGKAVGYSYLPDGTRHAFLFDGSSMLDINGPRSHNSLANALNDNGVVVGDSDRGPWQYVTNGATTYLRPFGTANATARSINSAGEIVGAYSNSSGQQHAFLFFNGVYVSISGTNSFAYDINDKQQVVGTFNPPALCSSCPSVQHAFKWENGTLVDLNTLAIGSGWVLAVATANNNAGSIVGYGTHNGETHAFLFKP